MVRRTIIALFSLSLFSQAYIPATAQDRSLPMPSSSAGSPWHISAERLSYDTSQDIYIAEGNVEITRDGHLLLADVVRYHPGTTRILASGDVSLTIGEDILTGTRMDFDLSSETGIIENGDLFSKTTHFRMTGASIQKTGKDTYLAERITVSTCDGTCPAWKITGKTLRLTVDGYGYVSHAALWVKNIPVFYSPFLSFSAKVSRQSGFLTPLVGHSDRQGFTYDQPLFWAIDPHSDATVSLRHMSERGTKAGLEYRYVWDARSQGTIMMDGLSDRKIDDGRPDTGGESDSWRYGSDQALRPNSDRYWFRMKQNQSLPGGYQVELDLDLVSDQDYLHEFRAGHAGYDRTENYYREHFHRVMDRYDDPVRVNRLNVRKAWGSFSLNGAARWYDDVIRRRQGGPGTDLHRLPFIGFNALKQRVLGSPLYLDVDTEYSHFYRETGLRGHRLDAQTRLYLPYRAIDRVTVEPSLGLRQTVWHTEGTGGPVPYEDERPHRGSYDLRLDLYSALYRIFAPSGGSSIPDRSAKHVITPRISYSYIPGSSQEGLPLFDALDPIEETSRLTYSLTNVLITKSPVSGDQAEPGAEPGTNADPPAYHRILRLELAQSYDWAKAGGEGSESLSPIRVRLEFGPTRYTSLDADAQWSTHHNRFASRNVSLMLQNRRGDRLSVEHRFTRDAAESISADIDFTLAEGLSAYGSFERNIREGKRIRQTIGLLYGAQCWSLGLRYSEEENDSKIEFSVSLYGLSDLER